MIVGIHQPNYLPYLGFFDKLRKSDVFIIYDDAQFNKSDFQHRNKIRIYHGSKWLTVPVEKGHIPLNKIRINSDCNIGGVKWTTYHLKEIHNNYYKAPYYEQYRSQLSDIYSEKYDFLVDINLKLIQFLSKSLNIKTKIVLSSEFGFHSNSTEKIIDLVKAVGGSKYLSGPAGTNYLDMDLFKKEGINLLIQEYVHPIYKQQYDGFVPYMSALDLLLNEGKMVD